MWYYGRVGTASLPDLMSEDASLTMGEAKQPKRFLIWTSGCQMNDHDSEIMRALLEEGGYIWTDSKEEADLIILNTCSVRAHAEQRVLGYLGNLKPLKKKKPELIIAVGGCMSQNPELVEFFRKKAPQVDIVFGTRNFHHLPELVAEVVSTGRRLFVPAGDGDDEPGRLPAHYADPYKAYVTIIYGCNNFCSYCIVPYARGREKSRPLPEVVAEVRGLAERGFLEVTLLGQNVNSYGKDLPGEVNFAQLLRELDTIPGLVRIRYMTSHPRDFTRELIDTIAASRKICEHFHLPVQSGSDHILKQMNRGYTRDDYFSLVQQVREAVPEATITTDLIVGFPGESDQDFTDTLDLVKRVRFDAAYTFLYSPRSGTPAAELPDQIPAEVKRERMAELIRVQNQISLEQNRDLIGKQVEILAEGRSKTNEQRWSGRTRGNKIVICPGPEVLEGKLVEVVITEVKTWTLFGKII